MNRYLALLRQADKKTETHQPSTLQNLQNPETGSFVGFEGTPPSTIEKKQALLVLPEHEEIPIDPDASDRYRNLTTCQQCANLTLGGGCRMKTGYKPMPDAKRDCGQFEPVQGERQAIADTPYTAAELEDLLARYESRLLAHVVNCPDCRISDRRYCADGFAVGSAYDALLMVFDDADDRHHAFVSRVIRKRLEGCK